MKQKFENMLYMSINSYEMHGFISGNNYQICMSSHFKMCLFGLLGQLLIIHGGSDVDDIMLRQTAQTPKYHHAQLSLTTLRPPRLLIILQSLSQQSRRD